MKRGRKLPKAELIAALRDCAINGLSYEGAAQELAKMAYGYKLTRSAVAGLACRAKPRIKFTAKSGHSLWDTPT